MARKVNEANILALAIGIAEGKSLAASARAAKIPETSARRYAADPGFSARVAALRKALVDQAVGTLSRIANKASSTLERLMKSKDDEIAFKAARAVLADLTALREHTEMYDRLDEIEKGNARGKTPSY